MAKDGFDLSVFIEDLEQHKQELEHTTWHPLYEQTGLSADGLDPIMEYTGEIMVEVEDGEDSTQQLAGTIEEEADACLISDLLNAAPHLLFWLKQVERLTAHNKLLQQRLDECMEQLNPYGGDDGPESS